jgi:hypothetical protein
VVVVFDVVVVVVDVALDIKECWQCIQIIHKSTSEPISTST